MLKVELEIIDMGDDNCECLTKIPIKNPNATPGEVIMAFWFSAIVEAVMEIENFFNEPQMAILTQIMDRDMEQAEIDSDTLMLTHLLNQIGSDPHDRILH